MKELIAVIDRSGVPIICIANDARATKIKSVRYPLRSCVC